MQHKVREAFMPRWYSVFFNPFYLIRRSLFKGIQRNKSYIQGKVLDFGCGSKPYISLFNCESYTGLDYATEVSEKNTKLAADVFYDGKTIPFEANLFDSVFSSEVLEHVFNPGEILDEINRVMKPGGHLVLTCPFFWPEHEQPYDYARYSSFGLKHLIGEHGFEVVAYEKTGSYFECLLQGWVLYLYYFIPHKPKALEAIFFTIFITPFLLLGLLLAAILPKRVKRSDFYLNNIIVARKK
jgi:SAM-dependent methyltransferase